jgi:hypothetical protein
MTEVDDKSAIGHAVADAWQARAEGWEAVATNLGNALEVIRFSATIHYLGGAFDPEHMRSLANLASDALNGDPIPAPPDPEEIRAVAAARFERLKEFIDWPTEAEPGLASSQVVPDSEGSP